MQKSIPSPRQKSGSRINVWRRKWIPRLKISWCDREGNGPPPGSHDPESNPDGAKWISYGGPTKEARSYGDPTRGERFVYAMRRCGYDEILYSRQSENGFGANANVPGSSKEVKKNIARSVSKCFIKNGEMARMRNAEMRGGFKSRNGTDLDFSDYGNERCRYYMRRPAPYFGQGANNFCQPTQNEIPRNSQNRNENRSHRGINSHYHQGNQSAGQWWWWGGPPISGRNLRRMLLAIKENENARAIVMPLFMRFDSFGNWGRREGNMA